MAKPVDFEGANHVFYAPPGTTPNECVDLPVFKDDNEIVSCWRLDAEELAMIAETGVLWLSVQGQGTPPVRISGTALVHYNGHPPKAEPVMPRAPRKPTTAKKAPKGPETPETA